MPSISSLLQKLQELHSQPHEKTVIDIDLMLDYSRQMYAALLEARTAATSQPKDVAAAAPVAEPVLPEEPAHTMQEEPVFATAPIAEEPQQEQLPEITEPVTPPVIVPQKDIRKLIGINDKYQIISELFHNDKEAYEASIQQINNSSSFAEAIDWLHTHVSWNYNWNEDNYTVQLFYGIIGQHFSEKEK